MLILGWISSTCSQDENNGKLDNSCKLFKESISLNMHLLLDGILKYFLYPIMYGK